MTVKNKANLLIVLPIIGFLFYTAYWFAAIRFIEDGVMNWITQEIKINQADIQFKQIKRSGFPFNLILAVDNFSYKQDTTRITAPRITLNINPLNWYSVAYHFNNGAEMTTQKQGQTTRKTISTLSGTMMTPHTKTQTDFTLSLGGVTLDLPPMRNKTTRTNIDLKTATFSFTATPAIPHVLNTETVAQWRQKNGVIHLKNTGVILDNAQVTLDGELTLTNGNQPQFQGHANVVNGREILNLINRSKQAKPEVMLMAHNFFGSFERNFKSADGSSVKIPISIKHGYTSIGPIPVMPMPYIHWAEANQ